MRLAPRSAPRAAEERAVAAIALAAVTVFADMYLTQPILPALGAEYGISPAIAGATISAVVFAIALASSGYGPLGEVLGRKRVMAAGCALLGLATMACAFAPNFAALVALRGVQGLLVPSVSAVAVAYLGDLRGRDIGGLVGVYIAASVMGGLIGRVASGIIADAWSWRASFVVFGTLNFASAVALSFALRQRRLSPVRDFGPAFVASYRAMALHLADSRLLGAFVAGATLFFGFIGTFTYLPYLLTAAPFSLSTGTIAWFYASYVAGIFTAPLAGRLSARIPRRTLIAFGFVVALLGLALTALPSLFTVAIGVVVLCIGMFAAQAIVPAFVNVTARGAKGGANALYQAFYYLGAVFGSTLPGLAWEAWGWNGVVVTCGASMLAGLAMVLAFCRERPGVANVLRATAVG